VGANLLDIALESSNFPGRYWTREGANVSLSTVDTTDFKNNATWRLSGR